jgi:hypothetical protein
MLVEGKIDLSFFHFYRVPVEGIPEGMEVLSRQEVKKIIINQF